MKKKESLEFNKKELFMFWTGILIALGGGILGNLLVGSALDIANNGYNLFNTFVYSFTLIILVVVAIIIFKQLNKILQKK